MSTLFTKGMAFIVVVVLLTHNTKAYSQSATLDNYIGEAFKNNENIHIQHLQLDKALYALKEAGTLFLPNISLLGTYTKAAGGRTIDLPIGDLLNPVYSSLNTLTASHSFPQVQNQSILLNPDNFYDTKFRTTLPLIDAELYYNRKIKNEQVSMQQASLNVYKRELVKSIKNAYYQCYEADKAITIYTNALVMVTENIRINESLLKNGVKNNTALTRAQTEKQKTETLITQARNNKKNAEAYFNFLLNKPLNSDIIIDTTLFTNDAFTTTTTDDITGREEFTQLNKAISALTWNEQMQRAYLVPKLNTFLDLGSQGFNFKYDNKTQYYMFGLNLQWDLFAAGRNNYKIKQAKADVNMLKAQYNQTDQALQLQMEQSRNNYNTAISAFNTARTQLTLAEKYYTDQLRVYKEGQLLYIELLDALNQLTDARLNLAVARANVLTAIAETERNTATYPINNL